MSAYITYAQSLIMYKAQLLAPPASLIQLQGRLVAKVCRVPNGTWDAVFMAQLGRAGFPATTPFQSICEASCMRMAMRNRDWRIQYTIFHIPCTAKFI